LDRGAVQLHHHPRSLLPLRERPVHHDRAGGRGATVAARLQHGQRQLRGSARVLQHQGARRAADLAAPASEAGDPIIVGRKATGTLLLDNLQPGRNLYLLGTGTGLAPFLSLVKDPETYERFERIVLLHGCRKVSELAYGETILKDLSKDEFLGDLIASQLTYFPTVTREPFRNRGRITDLIASGQLSQEIGLPPIDPEADRLMLCGSPQMTADARTLLDARLCRAISQSLRRREGLRGRRAIFGVILFVIRRRESGPPWTAASPGSGTPIGRMVLGDRIARERLVPCYPIGRSARQSQVALWTSIPPCRHPPPAARTGARPRRRQRALSWTTRSASSCARPIRSMLCSSWNASARISPDPMGGGRQAGEVGGCSQNFLGRLTAWMRHDQGRGRPADEAAISDPRPCHGSPPGDDHPDGGGQEGP
jgi:ferredoxin-NADP reductase